MLRYRGVVAWSYGAAIAPVLVGACVASAVSSTKTVPERPQSRTDSPGLPDGRGTPPSDGKETSPEVSADPPGQPLHGVGEGLKPKVHASSFTHRIERARIEARGAPRAKAGFAAPTLQAAATFDNEAWSGDQRRGLLAYLRGHAVEKDARFTKADARIVAQLQAGSGARANGEVGDETMAVLFAMGFRFSARKAMTWEVRLDFYPGEIEDLDAWNREIEEKVTKKGGGYRDVDAPEGEGSIYVHVGRSIVAGYRARGGPPSPLDDDGEHVAAPTTPGVYKLGPPHAHVTRNWYYSQIPWGAEIRKNDGGFQYRSPGRSGWLWATSNPAGTLKLPLTPDAFEGLPEVVRDGATFLTWNKNDFGPTAWNLIPSDMYLHTTPELEGEADAAPLVAASLPVSHGCVHIHPRDRDEMIKLGYLGMDTLFVVRRWDEHLLPDQVRHEMLEPYGLRVTP